MKPRAIVIGGTRFIGPHVVQNLRSRGCDVTVVHRGAGCADATHVHADRMSLPADLRGGVVIDMWCMTEAHGRSLVEHFRDERLVVVSSADVYRNYDGLRGRYSGPPDPTPLREDAPLRETRYPYREGAQDEFWRDYDKIAVEETAAGDRTTILRLPAVYGPRDPQHRFGEWLSQMEAGAETIEIDAAQASWRWHRGYAEEMAEAIVLAAVTPASAGRVYNAGEPDAPADEEWLRMLGEVTGWRGRIARTTNPPSMNFAFDLVLDTSAIRRDLGYAERRSRAEGLAATAASARIR